MHLFHLPVHLYSSVAVIISVSLSPLRQLSKSINLEEGVVGLDCSAASQKYRSSAGFGVASCQVGQRGVAESGVVFTAMSSVSIQSETASAVSWRTALGTRQPLPFPHASAIRSAVLTGVGLC